MATRVLGLRGMMCSVFLIFGLFAGSEMVQAQVAQTHRPSLPEACRAMEVHIADLLNQHRLSDDLDDAAFNKVMRQFYEAQSACTLGRFSDGLDLYSAIPIGRVGRRQLR
jgi:hypothetical protein